MAKQRMYEGPGRQARCVLTGTPGLPDEDLRFTPYLNRVCQPLAGLAPDEWTAELRAELACHLTALAEAAEELELSPTEAAEQACRQLGDPDSISREWVRRWQKGEPQRPEPFPATFWAALTSFGPAFLVAVALLLLCEAIPWLGFPCVITAVLGLPVMAGIRLGNSARGHRVLATAASVGLLYWLTYAVIHTLPGEDSHGLRQFLVDIQLYYWLPLGTVAAAVSGRARHHPKRRAAPAEVEQRV